MSARLRRVDTFSRYHTLLLLALLRLNLVFEPTYFHLLLIYPTQVLSLFLRFRSLALVGKPARDLATGATFRRRRGAKHPPRQRPVPGAGCATSFQEVSRRVKLNTSRNQQHQQPHANENSQAKRQANSQQRKRKGVTRERGS